VEPAVDLGLAVVEVFCNLNSAKFYLIIFKVDLVVEEEELLD
jgi:hypothetical protein